MLLAIQCRQLQVTMENGVQTIVFNLEDSTLVAGGDGCTFTNEMAIPAILTICCRSSP